MTKLNYRSGISIGEIILYTPLLFIGVLLSIRHGISRSAGWRFLVIFALVRMIGACFQLRTLADPTNVNLYIGEYILQNIGVSPLELITLGLLSRVIESINKTKRTIIQPMFIKGVELIVLISFILGIVGGTNAASSLSLTTHNLVVPTLSKASVALLIATYAIIVLFTALTYPSVQHAAPGEKRILLAISISLPFMLVRIIYSALYTLGGIRKFSSLSGNTTIYLVMALIMELIIIVVYEAIGVTLKKQPKEHAAVPLESRGSATSNTGMNPDGYDQTNPTGYTQATPNDYNQKEPTNEVSAARKVGNFLGNHTIVGKIITKHVK